MIRFIFITDLHLTNSTPSSRIDNYPEAIRKKLEHVFMKAQEYNCIIVLGGDTFNTPSLPDSIKNMLFDLIRKYGVIVYGIPGNHDLLYGSEEFISRTTLGVCFSSGIFKRIDKLKIGEFTIHEIETDADLSLFTNKDILIYHGFYGKQFKDKLYLNVDDIHDCKAAAILMGHDHNQYPIRNIEGTLIVRPGALSRGSSATENQVRVISYADVQLEGGKINVEYVPVPSNKFLEVFKDKIVPEKKEEVSFDDIRKFIEKLKYSKIKADPFDMLVAMQLPQDVYDRCEGFMHDVGLVQENIK